MSSIDSFASEVTNAVRLRSAVALAVLASAGAAYMIVRALVSKQRRKTEYRPVARVTKLMIYPVKSLAGVEVNHLDVTESVLKYDKIRDRFWMLALGDDFISLRKQPKLKFCTVRLNLQEDVASITIEAPGMEPLKVRAIQDYTPNQKIVRTKSWIDGDSMMGIDCGDEAASWFEKYLEVPGIRLLQHSDDLGIRPSDPARRRKKADYSKPITYQYETGMHLVNQQSLTDLNARLDPGLEEMSMVRCRANILVDAVEEQPNECTPYAEDQWKWLKIDDVEYNQLSACNRCVNTVVDSNGKLANSILKTLRSYRPANKEEARLKLGPQFGSLFLPMNTGRIYVGAQVLAAE